MIQIFYRFIYNRHINFLLRNINRLILPVFPLKIKLPPSGILKLKNSSGQVLKIATNQTNYLTYLVFWEGGYRNFEYTNIFIRLIRKVETFYDIGANIGYYSLIGTMENPELKVIGFEPAAGPLHFFRKNIELNGFTNIHAEDVALSDREGEIEFYEIRNKKYRYLDHNLGGEGNTGSKTTGRNFVLNRVRTTTLDRYVEATGEKKIDLIKMDTEGTENLILGSAVHVLRDMKPVIICETLFNTIEPDLEKIIASYGYEFYNHTRDGLKKVKSIIRKTDDGVSNCFFVHPEKAYLIAEFVTRQD